MKKMALYLSLIILLVAPASVSSSDGIPNVNLQVTVQQREDGKINKGFHVLELSCWDGDCSLSSLTLNQCLGFGSDKSFYPKVQYSSTSTGNLKVRNEGNSIIVQETGFQMGGDYVNSLRFDYERVGKDERAYRLIGFSGGVVKNSIILEKVFSMEYVPLPEVAQVMKLDCDVLLPGVGKK